MTVKSKPEVNSGELKVDVLGYMPAKKRIEDMMLAGQRLRSYKESIHDFPDGKIDLNFTDPTRRPGYDMADAFQDGLQIDAKLTQQQTAAEEKAAAEKAAQEEAVKASQAEYETWKASQKS